MTPEEPVSQPHRDTPTGHDPYRHWDGSHWLTWNGAEWTVESESISMSSADRSQPPRGGIHAATDVANIAISPADALGLAHPAPTRANRPTTRQWASLAALAIAIAIATTTIVLLHGSNKADSTAVGASSDGIGDAHRACTAEVNVALDVVVSNGYSPGGVVTAIGFNNPQYSIMNLLLATFNQYEIQSGANDAETRIIGDISTGCANARDPLLTRGQLDGLTNVAAGRDSELLRQITIVG